MVFRYSRSTPEHFQITLFQLQEVWKWVSSHAKELTHFNRCEALWFVLNTINTIYFSIGSPTTVLCSAQSVVGGAHLLLRNQHIIFGRCHSTKLS